MSSEQPPHVAGSRPRDHRIPVGVNLTSIGVSSRWWLETAVALESVGYRGAWCWDHFISRGRRADPVLECWTTLTAAAAVTTHLRVGSFVTNALNRHPAVLARMVATIHEQSGGRVEVGIGAGGYPPELDAYGIPFPPPRERLAMLEEALRVVRLLWTGGPVDFEGRFFRLTRAFAHPVPVPPPRLIVGAEKPASVRLAARAGDAWTVPARAFENLLPLYLEALEAAGRRREDVSIVVGVALERPGSEEADPVLEDLDEVLATWSERGANEIVVEWARPPHVPALLAAAERAQLASHAAADDAPAPAVR